MHKLNMRSAVRGRWRRTATAVLLVLALGAASAIADESPDADDRNFDKLWNHRDAAGTEKKFRALLPKARASWTTEQRLGLLTQIARTLGMQRKFDEAHALLDRVEKELTDDTKHARVRYLLERGRTHNSSKQAAKAVPLFEAAWELAKASKAHGHATDAAHMLGIAAPTTEAKLAWNEKAMRYAETTKAPDALKWLGTLYNNIGWSYHEAKQYEKALTVHTKGWLWWQARAPDSGRTRIAKWSVARQLRALGRARQALAMQRELLALYKSLKKEDGFVYEEIGECLLLLGESQEAKPHFAKAWRLLKDTRWIREAEPQRLPRLKKLGGVHDEAAPSPK